MVSQDIFDEYKDLRNPAFVAGYDLANSHTVKSPTEPYCELDVAVAMLRSDGNLSLVAEQLGRKRRSLEGFIVRTPLLLNLQADIEDEFLDKVETLHRNAALTGDLQTQKFFLMTKGKNRGYVTRNEATGKDGAALVVELNGKDAEL